MPEYKIIGPVQWPNGKTNVDGSPVLANYYTFTIDGVPTLQWKPEGIPPAAKTHHVQRTIDRLRAGRSSEAFGPSPVLLGSNGEEYKLPGPPGRGKVVQEEGEAKLVLVSLPGGVTKPREEKKKWHYTLDGVKSKEAYPSEVMAKEACAVAAFMSRGKLGQIPVIKAKLAEQLPGADVKVWACPDKHEVCATVNGERYALSFSKGADGVVFEKAKKLVT